MPHHDSNTIPTDPVVFRRWRDTGGVIALFPEIPSDYAGHFCLSYEQVGQHGGADFYGVVRATVPVAPQQYAPLARELALIGYRLRPLKRATRQMHERRIAAAREMSFELRCNTVVPKLL